LHKNSNIITSVHVCVSIRIIAVYATRKRSTREEEELFNIRDNCAFPIYEYRYRAASALLFPLGCGGALTLSDTK